MNENNAAMSAVWNRLSDHITKKETEIKGFSADELMASIFCPGPYYYYVVDFFDMQIKHMCPTIQEVLGLNPETVKFEDILARMHPDDMDFVVKAEETILKYIYENIGGQNILKYKMSYCFRFRTADDTYQLFQHQAIVLSVDEHGGFGKSLNIHTNINHITEHNSHKVTLMGIMGENCFVQLDLKPAIPPITSASLFTKREKQIIRLIADGLKNKEIAEKLFISLHTVKNHRKAILEKASTKSSSELIAKCITEGLI